MPTTTLPFDMHVHTANSPDARLSESTLSRRAAQSGIPGLGFVAHLDCNPLDYCYGWFDPDRYDADFDEAVETRDRNGPLLMKGVEIGEPHRFGRRAVEIMSGHDYDFVIGALHWVDEALVLEEEAFRAASDPMELVEEYYRQSLEMVECGGFDILAHLGIFRRGMAKCGLDYGFDEVRLLPELTRRLLEALIERRIALELNTSGLRRKEEMTYPSPPVLGLFAELGGTLVTIGSDTHRDPWVFYGLDRGVELLRGSGYESAYRYERGRPEPYPLR